MPNTGETIFTRLKILWEQSEDTRRSRQTIERLGRHIRFEDGHGQTGLKRVTHARPFHWRSHATRMELFTHYGEQSASRVKWLNIYTRLERFWISLRSYGK